MSRYNEGLQVVEKKYNGITVGFVVGWWTYSRRFYSRDTERETFRSFRNGVLFKTAELAKEFRDDVEKRRDGSGVKFSEV